MGGKRSNLTFLSMIGGDHSKVERFGGGGVGGDILLFLFFIMSDGNGLEGGPCAFGAQKEEPNDGARQEFLCVGLL